MVVVGEHDKHWMDGGPLTDRALQIVSASEIPAAVIPLKPGTGATASWSAWTAPRSPCRRSTSPPRKQTGAATS